MPSPHARSALVGLCTALVALFATSLGVASVARAAAPAKPNVLFILIDTLRADALGTYGQKLPTSPRIDAFAKTAVVYERAWTQYTWTGPSYVSYMTSRYARTHGWDYRHDKPDTFRALDDRAPMLAQVLQGAGYATSAQHSQPNLREDLNFNRGFDTFVRGADVGVVRGAVTNIGKWKADGKPNFLYMHVMAPHVPLLPSAAARAAVGAPATLEKGMSYDWWSAAPADQKAARLEEFRRTYLAGVRDADTYVGTVLDALDATGLAGETVVVIASDHGELIGEHGKIGHTATTAEALTHIPLIVRTPGTPPRREKAPASMIDIAPTLATLAGAAPPSQWQGRSLTAGGSATLVSERDEVLAVSDGTWKLVEGRASGTFVGVYDLKSDPSEKARLPATANPAVNGLVRAAADFRTRAPEQDNLGAALQLEGDEKQKQLEELRALGYIE